MFLLLNFVLAVLGAAGVVAVVCAFLRGVPAPRPNHRPPAR
jgi:hypothetical protein